MKKFLTSTIVLALVAALFGVFVACGNTTDNSKKDAETARDAIASVRDLYESKAKETAGDYKVTAVVKVGVTYYDVVWTIESDSEYKSNITVGERDGQNIPIGITKAPEVINYKLVATVTVGKATEKISFDRYVPAALTQNPDEKEASIFFNKDKDTSRTEFTDDQMVWTQNGITLTNTKGTNGTAITAGENDRHVRLYQGTTVKIEYPSMIKLIFHSETGYSYHEQLVTVLNASGKGTVTSDTENATATLALDAPADEIEFAATKQMRLTQIDVIAGKAGLTDEQKVDAALANISLAQDKFTSAGTYDLPAKSAGLNITWSLKEASDNATVDNNKLVVSTMPASEATLTLVASVTSGEETKTQDFEIKLSPIAGVEHSGTQDSPYKPSEAKAVIAATLAAGATGATEVYVKGYVVASGISEYNGFSMYIVDTYSADKNKDSEDALYIFSVKVSANQQYLNSNGEGFNKGDLVTFKGYLQNYKKDETTLIPEFTNGVCVAREAASRTDDDIVAEAKDTLTLTKTKFAQAGEQMDLPTEKSGATVSWAISGTTELVTVVDNKLTIVSLPATSTTITLTATFTSNSANGTKDYEITVEPLQTEHAGTAEDPFTLADVQKIGNVLANSQFYGGSTPTQVYVKGYIVKVGDWSGGNYNNFTNSWLIDEYAEGKDETSEGAVKLYRLGSDGVYITGETSIGVGDYIVVKGWIQLYSGKVQITNDGNSRNNPLAVDLVKAGVTRTDADIVAAAKTAVTLATSYNAGEVTVPLTLNGATLAWEVLEGAANVSFDGNKMIITEPAAQATAKVKVTITKGEAEDTKEFPFTILVTSTKGTEADPYTVAEIEEIFATLTDKGPAYQVGGVDKLVYIRGYVVVAGTDGQYGRDGVKIADTADATDGILIYGHNYDSNLEKGQGLDVGDKILVCGYLKIYNVKEIANGATRPIIKIEQKVELTDEQKAQKALDAVSATLTVDEAGEVELSTDTTVAGVTLSWSTEDTTYTVTDNKLNVAALPSMATTVTLKLTATCGSATKEKTVTATIKAAAVNYGKLDAPLSVTAALAIAADECQNSNDVTAQVVYMTGIVSTTLTDRGNGFFEYKLKDLTSSATITVYTKHNLREGVATPVQNDTLVICGYIKNYNGTIEFASNGSTYVWVESNDIGTSPITLEAQAGATVAGLPESALNGTEVSFTVAIATGKTLIAVKVNGNELTATDGSYSFTVAGNMIVAVTTADEGAAQPELLYTLTTSTSGSNNSYAGNCDVTVSGIKWNIEGNSQQNPWRFGGKNITNQDRKLTSKTAIAGKVTEVVINFGTSATATVNSVTLKVYKTDPTASGATAAYTKSIPHTAGGSYTVNVPENEDWTDCYYQMVFNVTCGGSNQWVTVSTMTFTGFAATSTQSDTAETVSTVEALAVDNKKTVA